MKRPERDIQRAIMDALKAHGIFCLRLNSGRLWMGKRGNVNLCPEGTADILALPNKHITIIPPGFSTRQIIPTWLEVKNDKGKQSPEQIEFQLMVECEGHRYAVVRSVDEALEALR